MRKRAVLVVWAVVVAVAGLAVRAPAAEPEWVAAMKKVHGNFRGNAGYVAQLGDSITYSMAFWSPMSWSDPDKYIPDDGLPKRPARRWRDTVKGARDKGGGNGNYSGWRIGNLLGVVDKVLAQKKPEAAVIMIGTNDIRGNKVPGNYESGLETVLTKCMAAGCVPILTTIPPMRGKAEGVAGANAIIKKLAARHKVPLIDYHAEIMKRRPNDWDGTLVSKDGVHPSGGKTNDYSEGNLKTSGYALRNFLTFMKFREVYFKVLNAGN